MGKNKLILFILLLFCGCSSGNEDIKFSEIRTIQAGSEFNSCALVEKVGDKEITKFDYDGNRILVNDKDAVICPIIDTSKIGKREIRFKFRDRIYKVEIEIIDESPPVISCKEKEIHLTTNKTENDLLSHVDVSDHDEETIITVTGIEYGKAGNYTAEINARDSSDNTSKIQITVIIDETREIKEKEETPEKNPSAKNETEIPNHPSPKPPKDIIKDNPVKIKAENKRFLFSDGYDYTSCYDAALSYAKEAMSKGLANGYTCEPIKSGKEYIGYEVIFK